MNKDMKYFICIFTILLMAACTLPLAATPAPTLPPVETTSLPSPTETQSPTMTPLPSPTETQTPTLTPLPTSTETNTPSVLSGLPGPVIPDGLGVNIHFILSSPAQLDEIANAGFRFVRMDMTWSGIEKSPGNYDFSQYDLLVQSMRQRGIRILFILDYGNPLYDSGLAPHTDAGRAAYAAFAAAAAARYAGKDILWEIWNEPNLDQFWKPRPNVDDYAALALTVIAAIRNVDPTALIIGPAVCCLESQTAWDFLSALGDLGVLAMLDGVSIHPYLRAAPEAVEAYDQHLRQILDQFSPGRQIPIVLSEWGYSQYGTGLTDIQQAEYLARAWLVNLANGVNLSIWYDWQDDCSTTDDAECHFGTVDLQLNPKPAYDAANALMHTLDGYNFARRI